MKNSPTQAEDTVSAGWRAALTLHDQDLQRRGAALSLPHAARARPDRPQPWRPDAEPEARAQAATRADRRGGHGAAGPDSGRDAAGPARSRHVRIGVRMRTSG